MDATTWARRAVAKLLAQAAREAAFEAARWALQLRREE